MEILSLVLVGVAFGIVALVRQLRKHHTDQRAQWQFLWTTGLGLGVIAILGVITACWGFGSIPKFTGPGGGGEWVYAAIGLLGVVIAAAAVGLWLLLLIVSQWEWLKGFFTLEVMLPMLFLVGLPIVIIVVVVIALVAS